MKIGIVTLSTPNIQDYTILTEANKKRYADKWGYDFYSFHDTFDMTRPPSWSKLLALSQHFNDNDWLMWMDADAVFMNHSFKIEDIINSALSRNPSYEFIVSADLNGINCGVFFVKTTDFMRKIFKEAFDKTEYINHPWWEQAALHELLVTKENFRNKTITINKKKINCYLDDFQQGDFILHLPGMTNEARVNIFKEILIPN